MAANTTAPAMPSPVLPGSSASGASSTGPPASSTTAAAPTTAGTSPSCSVARVVDGWPLSRRAALLVAAPVLDYSAESLRVAARYGVGGVLFLGDAPPSSSLASEISAAEAVSATHFPFLVMADEEGGGVQRLAGPVESIPWARTMAQTMTPGQVQATAEQVGREMLQIGVDVDLAPVLDVDGGAGPSSTDADGSRSYSAEPTVAAEYGVAFMRGLEEAGVTAVVKHFPGLGGSSGNTDVGTASTPPYPVLENAGLVPFRAALAAGARAVMVSNATVPGLSSLPSSLSPAVVSGLLRGQLRFGGLVVTDSLSAGAISDAGYSVASAAVASIEAGTDMILFGSTLNSYQTALLSPTNLARSIAQVVSSIEAAVQSGALAVSRLDQAVEHVLVADHLDLCG
jgi:beta-N-acetylhexosaminidase